MLNINNCNNEQYNPNFDEISKTAKYCGWENLMSSILMKTNTLSNYLYWTRKIFADAKNLIKICVLPVHLILTFLISSVPSFYLIWRGHWLSFHSKQYSPHFNFYSWLHVYLFITMFFVELEAFFGSLTIQNGYTKQLLNQFLQKNSAWLPFHCWREWSVFLQPADVLLEKQL